MQTSNPSKVREWRTGGEWGDRVSQDGRLVAACRTPALAREITALPLALEACSALLLGQMERAREFAAKANAIAEGEAEETKEATHECVEQAVDGICGMCGETVRS